MIDCIPSDCYADKDFSYFEVSDNVSYIGKRAFRNCKNLQYVIFGNNIEKIDQDAFAFCSSLKSILIPKMVKIASHNMFRSCFSLTNIDLNEIKVIEDSAFTKCMSLQSILIPNSVTTIESRAFKLCILLKNILLSESMTEISEECFAFCENLETIVVPKNIEFIDEFAFLCCKNLKYIEFKNPNIVISKHAFVGCDNIEHIEVDNTDFDYSKFGNYLKKIKDYRQSYQQNIQGVSYRNEPSTLLNLNVNMREYADMFKLYDIFSNKFNITKDQFILGNGAENVVKNALLALKPASMCWFVPNWTMLNVFCKALNISKKEINFSYNGKIIAETVLNGTEAELFYLNYEYTPMFKISNTNDFTDNKFRYHILDISYSFDKAYDIIQAFKNTDTIIIGSFDKYAGCGLRLGYAIYPKRFNSIMQLQREQFLNNGAYQFAMQYDLTIDLNRHYRQEILKHLNENDMMNDNYVTIYGNVETNLNSKHATVGKYEFTRFGIPTNDIELKQIIETIDKYHEQHS